MGQEHTQFWPSGYFEAGSGAAYPSGLEPITFGDSFDPTIHAYNQAGDVFDYPSLTTGVPGGDPAQSQETPTAPDSRGTQFRAQLKDGSCCVYRVTKQSTSTEERRTGRNSYIYHVTDSAGTPWPYSDPITSEKKLRDALSQDAGSKSLTQSLVQRAMSEQRESEHVQFTKYTAGTRWSAKNTTTGKEYRQI